MGFTFLGHPVYYESHSTWSLEYKHMLETSVIYLTAEVSGLDTLPSPKCLDAKVSMSHTRYDTLYLRRLKADMTASLIQCMAQKQKTT